MARRPVLSARRSLSGTSVAIGLLGLLLGGMIAYAVLGGGASPGVWDAGSARPEPAPTSETPAAGSALPVQFQGSGEEPASSADGPETLPIAD